ncbi:MAG: lysophospholipase, partial [Campylobacter sp.]|nr:lysophospholipase [Campylobacter sp.]
IFILILHVFGLIFFYIFQEHFLFHPHKLAKDFKFKFDANFTESFFVSNENNLNILHFYAKNPKGAVLFIHGNSRNLNHWGKLAPIFTDLGYDFYAYDYPGFGKSSGKIKSEKQLFSDAKNALEFVKKDFLPNKIILAGHSMGTGIASNLLCSEKLSNLLLFAPYFSMESEIAQLSKVVPNFVVRYPIRTHEFLAGCKAKITIIHGDKDKLIKPINGRCLAKFLDNDDGYYEISGDHNSVLTDSQSLQILSKRLKF